MMEQWPSMQGPADMAKALLARQQAGPPQFNFDLPPEMSAPLNVDLNGLQPQQTLEADLARRFRSRR